jgi:two-component sensor histidine kinase
LLLSLQLGPQHVAIDTGVSIGLVINELVTNSAKHAFSGDVGTISLAVRTAEPGYAVEVADSGAGIPDDIDIDSGNTLGFQLLHAIAGQHGGTVELLDRAEARVRVTLPGR